MSDRENGRQFSNSSGSSRRTSNDSIDDNIRKLVDSCEAEQNGPLNSQDLAETCKKFGLALEENVLMANGRCDHSNEDFNEQPSVNSPRSDEMNQNSSRDNFKEAERLDEKAESTAQNQTKEKWERDSGMDETNGDSTLQQIMAAASNAKGPSRSSNFLELASTLHLAALGSLKTDMVETTTKLEQVKQERDSLQDLLERATQERKEIIRDYEERLSIQAQQSEEHITELQSVIAELNKKLAQNSANKIDELEEVEIESHTSEHGSQSESESLESSGNEDDEMDEEISKVVGDFGFAIEREKPANKGTKKHGVQEDQKLKQTQEQEETKQQTSTLNEGDANLEKEKMRKRCSELQVRCLELEKKTQILERQLQQASLREYVSRKRSSGSTGSSDNQELQMVMNERDGLRTKLQESEQAMEQISAESAGFRNERDRLRKRLIEMQEQLKSLHQRSVQFENRVRSQSLESGTKSPRTMRANQTGSLPWEHRSNHLGGRAPSRHASSASSDVSSRDGTMTSPRICRRSSTDNLNTTGVSSRSGHSTSTPVRRPSVGNLTGPTLSPSGSSHSVRHPSGSVPSVSGQALLRPGGTSDYGSVLGSTQEITVMAKMVGEGLERGITGENCIRALSQLPEFASGKMPMGLVRALEGCRSAQEVYTSLFNFCDEQANREVKQYELDLERLKSRFDHLQAQNNVISQSLQESRDNAEHLSVLMGKHESNSTAFQLALNACDRAIESYGVLLQLAELEQAALVVKFHSAGLKPGHHNNAKFTQSSQNKFNGNEAADRELTTDSLDLETCLKRRRLVENSAHALLHKLERRFEKQGVTMPQGQSNAAHSRTSLPDSSNELEFAREDHAKLRIYVERLKAERLTVGMTLVKLDSITGIREPKQAREESLDPRLDLENAVLMQELMALKEEKAELKAKNYLVEKEKKALELRLTSRDAKEQAYLVHIDHLKSEMQDEIKRRRKLQKENGVASSKSDDKSETSSGTPPVSLAELRTTNEDIPSDSYEAAKREKKLKARIQELVEALGTLSKNSEVRHQQTAEYVSDLKKANGALVAAYEKAKKKHGTRLRKLEQQMMTMVDRNDKQVRTLKERIALLEEENRVVPMKQNETAL